MRRRIVEDVPYGMVLEAMTAAERAHRLQPYGPNQPLGPSRYQGAPAFRADGPSLTFNHLTFNQPEEANA